ASPATAPRSRVPPDAPPSRPPPTQDAVLGRHSTRQDDFADVLPFLHEAMRLRGLDQRERLADDGLDASRAVVGEEADHLASQHPDVIPEVTEIHADDGLVVVHELDRVEPRELRDGEQRAESRGAHAARGLREPEADEAAERRETAVALAERTRRVERDVDAAAAGDALDAFLE